MRNWDDWKEIKNIVKEKLDLAGFSFGSIDMAYDDSYVDFMVSSSGNDVFLRIAGANLEKLILVIDNDAVSKSKFKVEEIIKNIDLLKIILDINGEVIESNLDKKIVLLDVENKENIQLAENIARMFINLWPYIEGTEKINEECIPDKVIRNCDESFTNKINTKDTKVESEYVKENKQEDNFEETFSKISDESRGMENFDGYNESEERPTQSSDIEEEAATIAAFEGNGDRPVLIYNIKEISADEVPDDEVITSDVLETAKETNVNGVFIEERFDYNRANNKSVAEQTNEYKDFGNIYIRDNVPKRNGRTRLIKQIIGDTSLQLFFLLPDEEEHYVQIESYDTTSSLDFVDSYCLNQFRFFIYPKSPEKLIFVKVYIDGNYSYGRKFKIPNHLRTAKKLESIFRQGTEKKTEMPTGESSINNVTKENTEPVKYLNLDIEINSVDISIMAKKILKGE